MTRTPAAKGIWRFLCQANAHLLSNISLYFQALQKDQALFYHCLQLEFQQLFAEKCSRTRLTMPLLDAYCPEKIDGLALAAGKIHLLVLSGLCQTLAAHFSKCHEEVSW